MHMYKLDEMERKYLLVVSRFVYIEPSLHARDGSRLVLVNHQPDVLLDPIG